MQSGTSSSSGGPWVANTHGRGTAAAAMAVALSFAMSGCDGIPWVKMDVDGPRETSESGESVDVAITLLRRPGEVVTITAHSSDETEGTVSGPLRFDRNNWQTPQIFTVTGVDDDAQDGDERYIITLRASVASSPRGALVGVLHFVNRDDDGPAFDGLGDLAGGYTASEAWDVNDSGDVVVGWSLDADGSRAVRWTPDQGLQALEGAGGRAYGVSPDGTWITGSVAEPSPENFVDQTAARWTAGSAPELLVAPDGPPVPLGFWFIEGHAVLDDGVVFGHCFQLLAYYDPFACSTVAMLTGAHAYAADADGNYAGNFLPTRYGGPANAMFNGALIPYPIDSGCIAPPSCSAVAWDFVNAGEFIVGTSQVLRGGETEEKAWIRGQDGAPTWLTPLAEDGAMSGSGAYTLSNQAHLVGGFSTDADGQIQAVLWIDGAIATLEDLLEASDVDVPSGWQLLEVRALSPDGRFGVGNGINPEGYPEGFRVVLPDL